MFSPFSLVTALRRANYSKLSHTKIDIFSYLPKPLFLSVIPIIYSTIYFWWRACVLPQTDGERAADSCMLACKTQRLHERESSTERERGSISLDQISLCLPRSVRRYLTHSGLLHLSYLPPNPSIHVHCLPLSLCLPFIFPFSLSLFNSVGDFSPSLSLAHFPISLPYSAWVCVVVVCKKDHFWLRCLPK